MSSVNGGAGADTLIGGTGNDTYIVDNAGDVVVENAGEGVDQVNSSVTYTLSTNVENLTLTGSAAIDGTGNELDNVLIGNNDANTLIDGAGNHVLDGKGRADALIGAGLWCDGADTQTFLRIAGGAGETLIVPQRRNAPRYAARAGLGGIT